EVTFLKAVAAQIVEDSREPGNFNGLFADLMRFRGTPLNQVLDARFPRHECDKSKPAMAKHPFHLKQATPAFVQGCEMVKRTQSQDGIKALVRPERERS